MASFPYALQLLLIGALFSACAAPAHLPLRTASPLVPVSGRVLDLQGAPVVGATVHVSETSFSTTTDASGRFSFAALPLGRYVLLARADGFQPETQEVRLESPQAPADLSLTLLASATTVPYSAPDPTDLALFLKYFVGDETGEGCVLRNPEALTFTRTGPANRWTLIAEADAPLRFDNRRLGYEVLLLVERITLKKGEAGIYMEYDVQPFFTEQPAPDDATGAMRREARTVAFRGSLQHFLAATALKQEKAQGFEAYSGEVVSASSDVLATMDQRHTTAEVTVTPSNFVRPLGPVLAMTSLEQLKVHYYLESLPRRYYDLARVPGTDRVSWITPMGDHILFSPQGQLLNKSSVKLSGLWGATQVIDLMPLNYVLTEAAPPARPAVTDSAGA